MFDNLHDTEIKPVQHKEAKEFCKIWHYSASCPGCKLYYGMFYNEVMVGVIAYGEPAMRFQKKCYGCDIELRRLCLIDDTPRNAESYLIGKTLKMVKLLGFKSVLSLADPKFGHAGIIYRASNFEYMGRERGGGSRDIFIDGKHYHSRTAFAKFGASGIKGLEKIFPDKIIEIKNKERKHIYVYNMDRKTKRKKKIPPALDS